IEIDNPQSKESRMGLILLTIFLIALIAIGLGTGLAGFVRGNGGMLGTGAALIVVPGIALLAMSMTVVDAHPDLRRTLRGHPRLWVPLDQPVVQHRGMDHPQPDPAVRR